MDFALKRLSSGAFDLDLDENDVKTEEGLDTAVLMSFFSNSRVDEQEGYWGDFLSDIVDDRLGSTLWSVLRKKNVQDTRLEAASSMESALNWMVDDSVANSVEVEILNTTVNRVNFEIRITNFRDDRLTAFSFLWDVHRTQLLGESNGQA